GAEQNADDPLAQASLLVPARAQELAGDLVELTRIFARRLRIVVHVGAVDLGAAGTRVLRAEGTDECFQTGVRRELGAKRVELVGEATDQLVFLARHVLLIALNRVDRLRHEQDLAELLVKRRGWVVDGLHDRSVLPVPWRCRPGAARRGAGLAPQADRERAD